jgi:hypothetical protein
MSNITKVLEQGHEIEDVPSIASEPRAPLAPWAQREIILALLLLLCYGFFHQEPGWNEKSRYDLVLALVDDHTTRIDLYHENTGDKAFYNGHYYSDKAPGTALLAVPTYIVIRALSALWGTGTLGLEQVMPAFAFTTAGIPTVLLALLLLRLLRPLVDEWWALIVTAGYGLGTIAFPFATVYFGHAASTFFLFTAFYTLWCVRSSPSPRVPLLAGFLAGWAVLTEFTTILGVAVLLCYALSLDRRALVLMIAGALPTAVLLLGYHWVSFGGPFNFGYSNVADRYFATGMSQGMFGVTRPKLATLNEIMLGPRGLLRLSPWLALAPLGLWGVRRPAFRREVAVCVAISAAFLLFNSGYYLPLGGWTPGPRFLTPALPFAAVLVVLAPRLFRPLVSLLIVFSVALVAIVTLTAPEAPESVAYPITELWLPRFFAGDLAKTTASLRWGLHGAQPLIVLALAGAVALTAFDASRRPNAGSRWLTLLLTVLLATLVLALSIPFNLLIASGLGAIIFLVWRSVVSAANSPTQA